MFGGTGCGANPAVGRKDDHRIRPIGAMDLSRQERHLSP